GLNGDLFVQKAPAVTVQDLAQAVLEIMGRPDHPVKIMGTRHGEKLFEALLSREEMAVAQDHGRYYRVAADNRDLNYSVFEDTGETRITEAQDYNSHNAVRLSVQEMKDLLMTLDFIQRIARGEPATPED
ncbi:MAG: polysaccharide biosynthesis protein, partial [Alphaproteobacteria bacterium]